MTVAVCIGSTPRPLQLPLYSARNASLPGTIHCKTILTTLGFNFAEYTQRAMADPVAEAWRRGPRGDTMSLDRREGPVFDDCGCGLQTCNHS